ncbi:hypothetical protein DH2020_011337 [Rehmannia glutinosa]|uniref:RRM domain-containing protein n=1 Tax=Rehmannia glutinosa TaxID=99300 RepID=A0ABR0XD77_REHGL
MEQPSKNFIPGHLKISFASSPGKGKTAWGLPSRTDVYHASTDASLFSTSLPVLSHEKWSFLPGDENELFAGLIDDFDLSGLPTQLEDLDDDFFGSGGGLEIEPESQENLVNDISRLSISDSFSGSSISHYGFANGQYGDIRTLYTACKHRGFVMISYYDIRAARTAMRGLQNKPLRQRKLDIHFSIPKDNPSDKDMNQGTLVVFNLDASVSNDDLRQIFGTYGKLRRAAEAALKALNRCDIAGKRIKLEPSRPGGARRSLMLQLSQEQEQDDARVLRHQVGSPIANSPPGILMDGGWPNFGSPIEQNSLHGYSHTPNSGGLSPVGSNNLPGLASILPSHISSPVKIAPIGKDPARISHTNHVITTTAYQQHFSVPNRTLSASPGHMSSFSDSKPSSVGTLSGPQFLWGSPTIHSEHINSSAWSSGRPFISRGQRIGFPYTSHQHGSFLGSHHHHHHVGSAPSGIQIERHFGFYPESPETYVNFGHNNGNHAVSNGGVAFAGNFSESGSPSSRMLSMSRNGPLYFGNGSFGSMGDGIIERGRSRRADNGSLLDNKKQYQLDLEKIANGGDIRTTLMIKNIPNKYTSKMLLAAIDETHKGTYDFLYLPIDFKNKCNVGYAFINMVSPSHIITFYEAFNGKKWEKFNSEKVASLAYARIQERLLLSRIFRIQEPFPYGNLNIFIRQPDGSYAGDSLDSPTGDLDEKL